MPFEIVGFGEPLTVNDDLSIAQPSNAPAPVVPVAPVAPAAEAKPAAAAPKADYEPGDHLAADPTAPEDRTPKAEEKPADKPAEVVDDKPVDKPADAPADDEPADGGDKPDDSKDDKPADDKPADEKTGEEKPDEEKPAPEPSEADTLVEELGGVEILKAAQPFIDKIYDPDAPVSEKVTALEGFVPEAQMKDMRNEIFWQAVESPEIRSLLAADPEAQEAYAQTNFGIPFGYLKKLVDDQKDFLSEDDLKAEADKFQTATAPKQEPAKPAAAKEAPKVPAVEAKKSEPETLTPAFTSILGDLSTDVDKIFATGQLEPDAKDDDTTKQLKADAAKQFEEGWTKAFTGDEAAMKVYRQVKGLADQGSEKQAREKYRSLGQNAQRVAARLLEEVTKPLTEHRQKLQAKGKAAAAAHTETGAAVKADTAVTTAPQVDVSRPVTDADIERSMQEVIDRETKR